MEAVNAVWPAFSPGAAVPEAVTRQAPKEHKAAKHSVTIKQSCQDWHHHLKLAEQGSCLIRKWHIVPQLHRSFDFVCFALTNARTSLVVASFFMQATPQETTH